MTLTERSGCGAWSSKMNGASTVLRPAALQRSLQRVSAPLCARGVPAAGPQRRATTDGRAGRAHSDRAGYWEALWASRGDVFTLDDVNENLVHHIDALLPPAASDGIPARRPRVLVPLCGRSVDMAFLAESGAEVIGVDIAREALRRFAVEQAGGADPLWEGQALAAFRCRRLPSVTLLAGDVFAAGPREVGGLVDAVWDRAALTSIPSPDRTRYAAHLASLLAPRTGRVLVELLSCNLPLEGAMAASDAEAVLTAAGLAVTCLRDADVRGAYPHFAPPGLTELREVVLLARKG